MNPRIDGIFPDEVVVQILARLPVKSLFRSKTVCKLWYELVSEQYFSQIYDDLSIKKPMVLLEISNFSSSLICVDNSRGVSEFSIDFLKDRVKVRASCNGLLCCSSIPDKGVFYVCNPTTRKFKLLPKSRERPVTRFYPDGEATLVGLACNLSTPHKYNVVLAGYHRPFGHRPDGTFICLIFDSESNRWRKLVTFRDDHHQFTLMSRKRAVFVNGALHWLSISPSYAIILALDLDCETWREMALPDEVSSYGSGNRVYLLELDGCLSVVEISEAWMKTWVLKREEYESGVWNMVDRVSLRCIRGVVSGVFPISQTAEYIYLATNKQVLVYQRRTQLWKEMYCAKNNLALPLWFSAQSFQTTMFSCL